MVEEQPEQQSEWRRRITESMAATTYEQLKALVEGVTRGFDEVQASFGTLEDRLRQLETATDEARLSFGQEAENVRTAFAENANAVTERVDRVSAELVRDLTSQTQELSGQLAALGEEVSTRLQQLATEQQQELSRSRSALDQAAQSLSARVESAIAVLSQEIRAQRDEAKAAQDAASKDAGDRAGDLMQSVSEIGRRSDDAVTQARSDTALLKEEITAVSAEIRGLREMITSSIAAALDPMSTSVGDLSGRIGDVKADLSDQRAAAETGLAALAAHVDDGARKQIDEMVALVAELKAAVVNQVGSQLMDVLKRIEAISSEIDPAQLTVALGEALREQSREATTRWDNLVHQISIRRGQQGPDDITLVAVMRSLEKALDARDERLLELLEEAARAMTPRRRAAFLRRAKSRPSNPPDART